MSFVSNGPQSSTTPDVILHWLDDLHGSEARLNAWLQLEQRQRAAWLEDEGYSDSELRQSLALLVTAEAGTGEAAAIQGIHAALVGAIERLLLQGETIPDPLRPALAALLLERSQHLEGLGGGSRAGLGLMSQGLLGPHLLADYKSVHSAEARAKKLLQEAQDIRLGRFIEEVGGLEDRAAQYLTGQIDAEVIRAKTALDKAGSVVGGVVTREKSAYYFRKDSYIDHQKDKMVTAEKKEIAKEQAAKQAGEQPIDKAYQIAWEKGGTQLELGPKAQTIVKDDKAYFKQHDLATVQKSLKTKPIISESGTGNARSWSVTYDWDGSRGTFVLNKSTAQGDLDPTLTALNQLTAHALWSARQSAAIAAVESQQVPVWKQQLKQAHPKVSGGLHNAIHSNFPKAKLPTSYSQLIKQKRDAAKSLQKALHTKRRRARAHGVTLLSLQRRRDIKQLQQKTQLQHGPDPVKTLKGDLKQSALADLVAEVHKQLSSSKVKAFASNHASLLNDLKAEQALSTSTLTFSDRSLDITWTVGGGVTIQRKAKDPKGTFSDDPTLTLDSQSRKDAQDSFRLSVSEAPGGVVETSYFDSREQGTVVRTGGRDYQLSTAEQQQMHRLERRERRAFETSLRSSAEQAAMAQLQQHAGRRNYGRLEALGQRVIKNARTIHRTLNDVRADRRIEALIRPDYGSLRAQKLLINQLQKDRTAYIEEAEALRRLQHVRQNSKLLIDLSSLVTGIGDDRTTIAQAKQVYKTKPYALKKNSSGHGYHLVSTSYRKDYWQKLSEKQRYAIFNPIYHSETIFYNSERKAFLAGVGEYTTLRRDGASKKMARLGASATYFNTLLLTDKALFLSGQAAFKLAYAPFVLRRQLHVAKRVVHLNRHHFAWRLRLSWKIKREAFIYKHVDKYEQYMLNNKFTGFHPFHRIARKAVNLFKTTWHFVVHPVLHFAARNTLTVISLFSPKAAKWTASIGNKIVSGTKFLAWHIVKGLWHLPEHLYHHTICFGKQLLFAITHPWEYRKIWSGIKKDFRGIYRLGKTLVQLSLWISSVFRRSIFQVVRWATGNGANWGSILHGACSKKLWHKAKLIADAWKFAGLATLVGKTAETRVAIKLELLRMQLRRDLHHDGFLSSPWRHFVHQHKTFVHSEISDLSPTRASALIKAYHQKRKNLAAHKGQLTKDVIKYKEDGAYRTMVNAKIAADKQRAATASGKLKPQIQASLHSLTHRILDQVSQVKNKTQQIKRWTLRQYGLDFSQILRAYKIYKSLGQRGRKEALVGMAIFKDLNQTHKSKLIKTTLQDLNSDYSTVHKYFKTGANKRTTFAYALKQDWASMGLKIGDKLLKALDNSIESSKAEKKVNKVINHNKLGKHLFADILGGFWLAHYGKLFVTKDAALIAAVQTGWGKAATKMRSLEMVVSQKRVHNLLTYWLKRNANSVLAKDVIAINHFRRSLDKKIHKWERIERIGHIQINEDDLIGLQSLHKNEMLVTTLASAVAHTASWQDLTLMQQAEYRTSYDNWVSYNQTTHHGLDQSFDTFKTKDAKEYAGWQADKASIASGDSLTVGALLVSVKDSNTNNGSWVAINTIQKTTLISLNKQLETAAASMALYASSPNLLLVSMATDVDNHPSKAAKDTTPSLWAYIMQVRHWSHKLKKKLANNEDKEKAKKASEDAKKTDADVKADDAALHRQANEAEHQLKDGSENPEQLPLEAEQEDAASVEAIAADRDVDRLVREIDHGDDLDPEVLVKNLDRGDLKASEQELEQAELREQERLARELREAAHEDADVRDLEDVARVDREIEQGDFRQDAKQLLKPEEKDLKRDLRDEGSSLESEAEIDLLEDLAGGSDLLEGAAETIEVDTEAAEEAMLETGAELEEAAEIAAL